MGTDVAILIDLPGPKYRVGKLKDDQVVLKRGGQVRLTTEDIIGDGSLIPVNLPSLAGELGYARPGDSIIITAGIPIGGAGTTNMLKVQKVMASG